MCISKYKINLTKKAKYLQSLKLLMRSFDTFAYELDQNQQLNLPVILVCEGKRRIKIK